jgi:hypothetical protein
VAHVGVQRFSARHDQEHEADDEEADVAVCSQEVDTVDRVDGE